MFASEENLSSHDPLVESMQPLVGESELVFGPVADWLSDPHQRQQFQKNLIRLSTFMNEVWDKRWMTILEELDWQGQEPPSGKLQPLSNQELTRRVVEQLGDPETQLPSFIWESPNLLAFHLVWRSFVIKQASAWNQAGWNATPEEAEVILAKVIDYVRRQPEFEKVDGEMSQDVRFFALQTYLYQQAKEKVEPVSLEYYNNLSKADRAALRINQWLAQGKTFADDPNLMAAKSLDQLDRAVVVDFNGVLMGWDTQRSTAVNPDAPEFLQTLSERGHHVVIWTRARGSWLGLRFLLETNQLWYPGQILVTSDVCEQMVHLPKDHSVRHPENGDAINKFIDDRIELLWPSIGDHFPGGMEQARDYFNQTSKKRCILYFPSQATDPQQKGVPIVDDTRANAEFNFGMTGYVTTIFDPLLEEVPSNATSQMLKDRDNMAHTNNKEEDRLTLPQILKKILD